MPFKSFAHLARVSLAKGITHAYAPAAVAGQSIGGQFHNSSVGKLSKTSHLQNVFTGPSSSGTGAGAGAKTGHASQSGGSGDAGLAQYYAAWQHAQQTGDDSDWRQHQFARRIEWKQPEKQSEKPASASKPSHQRLDSIRAVDILRPSAKQNRGYSESALTEVRTADQALSEEEALAKVDEAIALEIKNGQEAAAAVDAAVSTGDIVTTSNNTIESSPVEDRSVRSESLPSPSTHRTTPSISESQSLSDKIVSLGQSHRYVEVPQYFETMIRDGLVPTVDAYNQIITAAIKLSSGYQPYPRALEVYGDMTARSVRPNRETYQILISFLTRQSLEAFAVQKDLTAQRVRHGSLLLPSVLQRDDLYSGDVSLQFASKFYNIAANTFAGFELTESQANTLLRAYALSGSVQKMTELASDMRQAKIPIRLELYPSAIEACTTAKDIELAKTFYIEYRDRAIGRILDPLDVKVYIALIRAFFAAGQEERGIHFYEQILASFEGSADKVQLVGQVTDAFVLDGLLGHHIEAGEYQDALNSLEIYSLSEDAKIRAMNKICQSAADYSDSKVASDVVSRIKPTEIAVETLRALAAMHLRSGRLEEARDILQTQTAVNVSAVDMNLAVMYALTYISTGKTEDGLAHVRSMFRQIRAGFLSQTPSQVSRTFDEAICFFAESMARSHPGNSAEASILIFRLMIENGGLIPAVTQSALAHIGPDCVNQLNSQDIALALHVQAYVLPIINSLASDAAQPERFAHLLETVLNRGILMDPSTLHAISDALPRLKGARPDLEQRWRDLMRPSAAEPPVVSPALPASPRFEQVPASPSFDPYANTTDHRASRTISDLLESTSGRFENHIADAMARLRNVRRMGRHLQYGTYAKLITAAGKAKQTNLMHEILGMAQTDVPLDQQIPAIKAGWISIYDAMVAACLNAGDRHLAAKYHQEIRNMGAAPSANTFGIYITTLEGTFDEATEAVKIFQQAMSEGVNPSVFLYNAVIGKLGKARRIDDCLQYFAQMQNQGIRPSSVTYGTLVNALCRTSEESFAVEMFDEMEAATNYRPRPAPYNSIIQYFLNTKRDRTKVLQYYGRMRSKGIMPTSHTYKLLIEAYATLEPVNLTAAETMLEDMKANGIQPESVHYGSLIHARGCVLHDMDGARKVFDSVLADGRIKPTDNLYQNLLESMVANHDVANTDAVLADMKNRGIEMTPYIANTLIHGWAGRGDIAKARSIYERLGNGNREPSTYEAMTRAFLAVDDHAGANAVVTEMLAKGYPSAVSEKMLALVGENF